MACGDHLHQPHSDLLAGLAQLQPQLSDANGEKAAGDELLEQERQQSQGTRETLPGEKMLLISFAFLYFLLLTESRRTVLRSLFIVFYT